MADSHLKKLSRTALLLALTIVFQSLRFMLPIPPVASTFLIGSLVNASLLITLQIVGIGPALLISCIAPGIAYFQQLLPLPVFIIPVAIGNCLYVWLFFRLLRIGPVWPAIGGAAFGKAAFYYLAFSWLLTFIQLPPVVTAGLLFVMGWPQLVTGILGGVISRWVVEKLHSAVGNGKNS